MVGKYTKDSKIVNSTFDTRYINLSTSKSIDTIGKKPLLKIGRYLKILILLVKNLFVFNPSIVYMTITAKGVGFYKDFPLVIFTKLFRKTLVLHYHNKGVSLNQNKIIDNLLYKILFKNTKVILLSERLCYDVKKYVKKNNLFYCPNGIPFNDISSITLEHKVPQILFLSNLIESKGVFVLLDALKILKKRGVCFFCNLVGGDEE